MSLYQVTTLQILSQIGVAKFFGPKNTKGGSELNILRTNVDGAAIFSIENVLAPGNNPVKIEPKPSRTMLKYSPPRNDFFHFLRQFKPHIYIQKCWNSSDFSV